MSGEEAVLAAPQRDSSGGKCTTTAVETWWRARGDEAIISLLRIEQGKFDGVNTTSQTGRSLRLTSKKVHFVDRVSCDRVNSRKRDVTYWMQSIVKLGNSIVGVWVSAWIRTA